MLWQEGKYDFLKASPESKLRQCQNPKCAITFQVDKPSSPNIYCSSRCAALINNKIRIRKKIPKYLEIKCLYCNNYIGIHARKYCNTQCQNDYVYQSYIKQWKQGLINGTTGINVITLSGYIRRYLKDKYGEKCSLCGWNEKHPKSGKVPIEIDHIDGNSDNNKEENLRLICPNCHSLTASFRNYNKGKGRAWRLTYIAEHKNSISS